MKEYTSRKRQSSWTTPGHTPNPFQPRPFAPTPEAQTPEVQTPTPTGPISGPSFHTFSIQDPSGTTRQQPIQPKLTIGAAGDKYEQEADRVASQVVQQIHAPQSHAPLQRDSLEANKLQMKPILQRNTLEEDELQMRPSTNSVEGGPASASLESAIFQAKGSGQSLDPNLQQQMGQAMGADFSGVTIHTDSQSDQLNRSIQAKAFTTGQDIFFRQGAYQPGSRNGQELIAHELTHVVQQNGDKDSRIRRKEGEETVEITKINRRNTVQRTINSRKALKALAEPKVGQQDLELAKSIEDRIEKIYENTILPTVKGTMKEAHFNDSVCLGGIVLPPILDSKGKNDDIADKSEFVNIGKASQNKGMYDLLSDDLKADIIKNTLETMLSSGQLNYLEASKFGGKKNSSWKVLVEVHYYRNRPAVPSAGNRFHKDTLGQTLFVNLNYLNDKEIVGPEYVVNPQDSPQHMEDIKGRLPKDFLKDLAEVKKELPEPEIIGVAKKIPQYGYVAFTDELIHHATPTSRHRKVSGKDIHEYLKNKIHRTDYYDLKASCSGEKMGKNFREEIQGYFILKTVFRVSRPNLQNRSA